jgi:predicted dehydrogenase
MTIKVCIVGCGQVANWRLDEIKMQQGFEISAVVDPVTARAWGLAEKLGRRTQILTELPSPTGYDLAIIQTPNGSHRACAQPFIEAGVPVVIEKPLAIAWEDIRWFDYQAALGAWICGAYNSRYAPGVRGAVTKAAGQKIVALSSVKYRSRKPLYYEDGWHGTWEHDGGVLAQQAIHCIDLVCWIAGRAPTRVAALGFRQLHDIECEDTGTVLMDFGDFAATVTGTTAAGRNGMAALDIITTSGIYGDQAWGWDDGAGMLWLEIQLALAQGLPPPVGVPSILPGLHAMHAAYVSMDRGGDWVPIGSAHRKLGRTDLSETA